MDYGINFIVILPQCWEVLTEPADLERRVFVQSGHLVVDHPESCCEQRRQVGQAGQQDHLVERQACRHGLHTGSVSLLGFFQGFQPCVCKVGLVHRKLPSRVEMVVQFVHLRDTVLGRRDDFLEGL